MTAEEEDSCFYNEKGQDPEENLHDLDGVTSLNSMKSHRNSADSLEQRWTKNMTETDSRLRGEQQGMSVR